MSFELLICGIDHKSSKFERQFLVAFGWTVDGDCVVPVFIWDLDHDLLFAGNEHILKVIEALFIVKIIFATDITIKIVRVNLHLNMLIHSSELVEEALDVDKGWSFLGLRLWFFWFIGESDQVGSTLSINILESAV